MRTNPRMRVWLLLFVGLAVALAGILDDFEVICGDEDPCFGETFFDVDGCPYCGEDDLDYAPRLGNVSLCFCGDEAFTLEDGSCTPKRTCEFVASNGTCESDRVCANCPCNSTSYFFNSTCHNLTRCARVQIAATCTSDRVCYTTSNTAAQLILLIIVPFTMLCAFFVVIYCAWQQSRRKRQTIV